MIVYGGFLKGRAVLFAVMGVVFIVIGLLSPSFIRTTFIIIGVADLVAAGFSYWMGKKTEPQDPSMGGGQPGNWVG
jgi:membrane-bound ClpP family serine protease